jgi:UDP-N-acetylglucosamine--N-acetylmuramyl-(pentapeptide) pyrophosphoryl-undecaprenol N-acetylglucosamine transferase
VTNGTKKKLLIAASGTGGHLFPAIALATQLSDYHIEWLGVPDRLERQLVPEQYLLHTITVEGFQQKFGLGTIKIFFRLIASILQVRKLLKQGNFSGVFTTGGYISSPAIIAAKSLGLPVILHESNSIPGKVTKFFSSWCKVVAIGFSFTAKYLPKAKTICVGTPVRSQFMTPQTLNLPIPENVPLIAVVGGSQGAVAVNKLVRECAEVWLDRGIWIFHQTGNNDPDVDSIKHPHYIVMPFYDQMAGIMQRANLAICRSGSGTLTELAVTKTPSILIPFPFAAEDHQAYNGQIFVEGGAAIMYRQNEVTPELLTKQVLELLENEQELKNMSESAGNLAILDSAERLANLVREVI